MLKKNNDKEGTEVVPVEEYVAGKNYEKLGVATFAGGCFWCTEASFEQIQGVVDVISGYSGGTKKYPTYYEVGEGTTGHAEAIQIYYKPDVISFDKLLDIFFVSHDPTQLNRQGPDVGEEYRSAIFYHNDEQKQTAAAKITALNKSGKFDKKIVTELSKYDEFWVAEGYHQDYFWHNPNNPYVQKISKPKVEKVKKEFKDILKKKYKK